MFGKLFIGDAPQPPAAAPSLKCPETPPPFSPPKPEAFGHRSPHVKSGKQFSHFCVWWRGWAVTLGLGKRDKTAEKVSTCGLWATFNLSRATESFSILNKGSGLSVKNFTFLGVREHLEVCRSGLRTISPGLCLLTCGHGPLVSEGPGHLLSTQFPGPHPTGSGVGERGLQGSAPGLGRRLGLVVRSGSARLHADSAAWSCDSTAPQINSWRVCPHPLEGGCTWQDVAERLWCHSKPELP